MKITIIRHGEKTNNDDDHNLSQQGFLRSYYLVNYFKNDLPNMIYCFLTSNNLIINRSLQLMLPLILTNKINYNQQFNDEKKDTEKMVNYIFSNSNDTDHILIWWEHLAIPDIINQIGKKINKDYNFKSWSINNYNKNNHDDNKLFSLTIEIDTITKQLNVYSQDDFEKDTVTINLTPRKLLFSIWI